MAKISAKNVELKDGEKIIFGTDDDSYMMWDGTANQLGVSSTVSGVYPIQDYHLITKEYLFDVLDGTASGVTASGFNTIFGANFNYVVDESESSTNSVTYVQKLRLTATATVSGSYRIGWTFEWRGSKLNEEFEAMIQLDDSITLFEFSSRPVVDVNTWRSIAGFYYAPTLNSGTHTIDVDYRSSDVGATAYIRKSRIEFWRVF